MGLTGSRGYQPHFPTHTITFDIQSQASSRPTCTPCGHRMAHRKWKETKLQRSMLPGSAVPGCSLETGRTTQHVTGAPLPNFFGYSVPHPLSLLRLSSTDLGSCCEAKAILHTGVCCKRKVVSKRTYREVRFGEVGTFK